MIMEKRVDHEHSELIVRSSTFEDIEICVGLSKAKRLAYEKAQPLFWRYAGESAEQYQAKWFAELLLDKNYLLLTAESSTEGILGFIVGKCIIAPEVYAPGGLTLMIDDFCVITEDLWDTVGLKLLERIKIEVKNRGVVQLVVVCGSHDKQKRDFVMKQNLSVASEWFVGGLGV
jgi:hypothetical protein